MPTPVCPLLSDSERTCLCVEEQCAFYVPQARKCAMAMLGLNALMSAQQMQASQQHAAIARPSA
jgi:hypothetical protein